MHSNDHDPNAPQQAYAANTSPAAGEADMMRMYGDDPGLAHVAEQTLTAEEIDRIIDTAQRLAVEAVATNNPNIVVPVSRNDPAAHALAKQAFDRELQRQQPGVTEAERERLREEDRQKAQESVQGIMGMLGQLGALAGIAQVVAIFRGWGDHDAAANLQAQHGLDLDAIALPTGAMPVAGVAPTPLAQDGVEVEGDIQALAPPRPVGLPAHLAHLDLGALGGPLNNATRAGAQMAPQQVPMTPERQAERNQQFVRRLNDPS